MIDADIARAIRGVGWILTIGFAVINFCGFVSWFMVVSAINNLTRAINRVDHAKPEPATREVNEQ